MSLRTLAASLAVVAVLLPLAAHAKGPDTYPLDKVKAGQKGYGLTVFKGTTPERFEFEVVGVARHFLPKMDLILVKSEDPKLKETGFAQGMSGSPLYLEDKVACAFSYAWRFTKIAFGACTPIEYMIADAAKAPRGPEATPLASREEWDEHTPMDRFHEDRDVVARGAAGADDWLLRAPLPAPPVQPTADGDAAQLARAQIPLAISGMAPSAFAEAKKVFQPFDLEPMQGGAGAGDPDSGPTQFEMGAPIGVQLVRGDISIDGTGTVSYVDGSRIVAFGHPMFGAGEIYAPVTSANIHLILPSSSISFKLSSALRPLGSLVQDRLSSITADTTKTAELIPLDLTIKGPNKEERFHTEVMRHRFLTPQLVMLSVASAAQVHTPDIADVTMLIKSKLLLKDHEPLEFTDYLYSPDGASVNAIASARAIRALVPLLFNPFAPVRIRGLEIEVEMAYKADYAEIVAVRTPHAELPAGKETYVDVVLRPYGGKEYTQRVPLTIPERLAGSTVKLEIVPGDVAKPDVAPPESLDDVLAALQATYDANTLVATIYTPDEGITLDGKVLPDLPDSALDSVRQGATSRRTEAYRTIERTVVPSKRVVMGRQELVVKIKDKK